MMHTNTSEVGDSFLGSNRKLLLSFLGFQLKDPKTRGVTKYICASKEECHLIEDTLHMDPIIRKATF